MNLSNIVNIKVWINIPSPIHLSDNRCREAQRKRVPGHLQHRLLQMDKRENGISAPEDKKVNSDGHEKRQNHDNSAKVKNGVPKKPSNRTRIWQRHRPYENIPNFEPAFSWRS